jgi:hypothetical protein
MSKDEIIMPPESGPAVTKFKAADHEKFKSENPRGRTFF